MPIGHQPPVPLETDRLLLRPMQRADIPFLVNLWSDPLVTRFMGGPRDRDWLNREFETALPTALTETYDLWPVAEKKTGVLVGHCGLLPKDVEDRPEIEINYIFMPAVWGRGFATEMGLALVQTAFAALGLKRLIALIDPENSSSERVAVKIGMRFDKDVLRPRNKQRKVYVMEKS